MERLAKIILWGLGIGWGAFFFVFFIRVFVCDQFVVPSDSMLPTLIPGDRILVNKLIFGGRIYKNYNFNDTVKMQSFRMPRLRIIRPNDIVVFNAPNGYHRNKIEFKINYVYAKRCLGTPGDTIQIIDSHLFNNNFKEPIGCVEQQENLANMPDSLFSRGVLRSIPKDDKLFGWTIKNMGPLYVPKTGVSIELNMYNYKLYRLIIEYETGEKLRFKDGRATLNGESIDEYEFKGNYYFFCGDNVADSKDSRYLGFVPEEFIVGVVNRISYSREYPDGNLRYNRIWVNPNR